MAQELTVLMNTEGTKVRFYWNPMFLHGHKDVCIGEARQQDDTGNWWVFRSHEDIIGKVQLAKFTTAVDMAGRLTCIQLAMTLAMEYAELVDGHCAGVETVYRDGAFDNIEDMVC